MIHNIAFSYVTVTQDITYHNAEINAGRRGMTMTDRGLRMEGTVPTKSFCQFCDKFAARYIIFEKISERDRWLGKFYLCFLNSRYIIMD